MEAFLGTILLWPLDYAPDGWALCNGQILQVANNQALFSLLGNRYGGDGRTTFGLPDLRTRFPLGAAAPTNIGQIVNGPAQAIINSSNLPTHTHTITSDVSPKGGSTVTVPVNLDIAIPVNTDAYPSPMPSPPTYTNSPTNNNCTLATGKTGNNATTTNIYTTNPPTTSATLKSFNVQKDINVNVPSPTVTSTCSATGSTAATTTAPVQIPSITLNYIMCIVGGIYPMRP